MTAVEHPRRHAAWPVLLAGLLTTLGASLLAVSQHASPLAGWATGVSWLAAWVVVAGFRLLTYRRRWPWLVYLTLVWLMAVQGTGWAILAMILLLPFLMRQQDSLRLLQSRTRAGVFLAAVVVFAGTFVAGVGRPEGQAGDIVLVGRTGVQAFWLSAILTLLFNMRLHFLRLRPKLAVAGVLVGLVPMLLLTVFGVLLLYGSLGGARANSAHMVLDRWRENLAAGNTPAALTAEPIVWREAADPDREGWPASFVRSWRVVRQRDARDDADQPLPPVPALADTTVYVGSGASVWLVRLRDPGEGAAEITALPIDQAALESLARDLRADVFLLGDEPDDEFARGFTDGYAGDATGGADEDDGDGPSLLTAREGRFHPDRPDTAETSWWRERTVFGATLVDEVQFVGGRIDGGEKFFLGLRTSPSDLVREYASEENPLTTGIMVALGIVAVLLAVAGLVALIFSSRITGGITGAVRELHRGTRRLAAGDLDVEITVDNEDEFGDLARSFNEMTRAVKQGREDALARERLQQEMETARKIQERLLPHDQPLLAGWEVTGLSIPSLQVGGDYFDFVSPGEGRLGVAIGDVSGKGVPAALLMSNLQACLKGQVLHPAPVSDLVARINDLLAESTDVEMFATFIYGELDAGSGRFTCTNAGHDPGLVVRRDGTVEWLETGGLILGMLPDQEYQQTTAVLEPGDVLVLYTDGITEAGAPTPAERAELDDEEIEDHEFGEERLAEVVVAARERSALDIRESILRAVQAHLGQRPQGDDITLVVIRRGEALAPGGGPDDDDRAS
ncbi:SpoIIE family protein phosphatase [bacterium]|nr:SpoIIE family protein phosphatase [bacterium]